MLLALLLALSLADPAVTGVVKDTSGRRRAWRLRDRADLFRLRADGHRTRRPFCAREAPRGAGHVDRSRRRLRREAAAARRTRHARRRAHPGRDPRSGHRHPVAYRATAWRCPGQHRRPRCPADQAITRRRRRRCAAADSDLQPVPPDQQPVVAPDRARRVAARHRPERGQPHPGDDRQRAVQRSVRRLGLLDPGAARERRSDRSGRRPELECLR